MEQHKKECILAFQSFVHSTSSTYVRGKEITRRHQMYKPHARELGNWEAQGHGNKPNEIDNIVLEHF